MPTTAEEILKVVDELSAVNHDEELGQLETKKMNWKKVLNSMNWCLALRKLMLLSV